MSGWTWEYDGWDPAQERLREALCTLGNGRFATRGAAPEAEYGGPAHYPGTYAAGVYNRLVSTVAGRRVENEDMVNLPNWLPLRYRVHPQDGPPSGPLGPGGPELLDYRLILDMAEGSLTRRMRYRVGDRARLSVEHRMLVHMGDPMLAALHTTFTAEGWSGTVEAESSIDGTVANTGVARYHGLAGRHLTHLHTGTAGADPGADTVWLRCRTTASDIRVALALRTRSETATAVATAPHGHRITQRLTLPVAPGRPGVVEKTAALVTSRDPAVSEPLHTAVHRARQAPGFAELLASQRTAWHHLWRRSELHVPGEAGRILRLHVFHVLQTLSGHTADLDAGVPARGLHGEAYRGHVFWDELFVLPYLNLHFPEVSRALLGYRHRRLPEAVRAARAAGRPGALYPWQSGSDGREEAQQLHLNPRSGRWVPDRSHLQHHVGSAVAYDVWQYCQATGDTEFLYTKGAEMVLQIARFWAGSAVPDARTGRYRILGVMGPDEYHDAYPGSGRPGVDDNAYTNVTAAWVLCRALELVRTLPPFRRDELLDRLRLDDGELQLWEEVSRGLTIPFHEGVVSQFDGYGELLELDWAGYRARYGDIRRLDRLLEAEGDSVNRYQASKQADVLMLGYLFAPGELADLFARLGHRLDDEIWERTVDHYLARTSHGSTLSGLVHGWVLARARRADAWRYCQEALVGDVMDIQGGTTAEGIHLGAMAGTLDLVQRGLTGLETREGALWLDPVPLPALSRFGFRMRYRGHWGIRVRMEQGVLSIAVPVSEARPIRVELGGRRAVIHPGEERLLACPQGCRPVERSHAVRRR